LGFRLLIAIIVFTVAMFCGLVIVGGGVLSGQFNSMYPYTAKAVCAEGENLVLETGETTTTGGTVVIDNTVYNDVGFTENTIYCVNEVSGERREVTVETYEEFERLKTRIGWWATIGIFLVTMTLLLVFERPILRRLDRVIGYQPADGK
jgi:hypothetical protein